MKNVLKFLSFLALVGSTFAFQANASARGFGGFHSFGGFHPFGGFHSFGGTHVPPATHPTPHIAEPAPRAPSPPVKDAGGSKKPPKVPVSKETPDPKGSSKMQGTTTHHPSGVNNYLLLNTGHHGSSATNDDCRDPEKRRKMTKAQKQACANKGK